MEHELDTLLVRRKYNKTVNVYAASQERIKFIFDNFPRIYLSFSGGKDSGVMLNLVLDYMRKHGITKKIGVMILDNEANYEYSLKFMHSILGKNLDLLDIYWCCLPITLPCTVSAYAVEWRGRDFTEEECKKFDLQSILGHPCMLSVIANEKGKSKVGGVMKMPKGQSAPEPTNKPYAFWLDEFQRATFEALSEGIKKIIMKSPEYQEITTPLPQATPAQAAVAQMKKKTFDEAMAEVGDIPF